MSYTEIIQSLSINLSKYFDTVYHSAEIVNLKDKKFPAIGNVNEWDELSPTDQKEIVYIRRNGDDQMWEEQRVSSCSKDYKMRSKLRIVYFKDNANNPEEILFKLMQSVLITGTKIESIIRDKYKLQKDESSGEYSFKATTAYFAIDIYAFWNLSHNVCEQDFCIELDNPVKKCVTV